MTEEFNPVKGFTQVPHETILDPNLSDGAFRTFALYLYYAQLDHWPDTWQIRKDHGRSKNAIMIHNKILEELGYITRKCNVIVLSDNGGKLS